MTLTSTLFFLFIYLAFFRIWLMQIDTPVSFYPILCKWPLNFSQKAMNVFFSVKRIRFKCYLQDLQ